MQSKNVRSALNPRQALLTFLASSIIAASAFAQSPKLTVVSQSDYPAGAKQFVVHSALAAHDFVVVVSPPPIFASWISADLKTAGAKQINEKLPAIYALDGGYGIAGPIAQMMVGVGTMSPAYVVSIGYREGETGWHRTDLLHRTAIEGGVTYGGGGDRFEGFLTEELRPFLEAKYPLDPARAILFGHSFGGLFAANVLAESPDAFAGYIVASPSVWIDPQVLEKISSVAKENPHRIFVAAGGDEEPRMLNGTNQLTATLTAAPSNFRVEKKIWAGEDHISYYPLLVEAAFAWILPPPGHEHTAMTVPPEALQRIAGVYELADGRVVTVTLQGTKAFVQVTGMPGHSELLAETEKRFFLPGGYGVTMTFDGAMNAPASSLIINMNGSELRGSRKTQ